MSNKFLIYIPVSKSDINEPRVRSILYTNLIRARKFCSNFSNKPYIYCIYYDIDKKELYGSDYLEEVLNSWMIESQDPSLGINSVSLIEPAELIDNTLDFDYIFIICRNFWQYYHNEANNNAEYAKSLSRKSLTADISLASKKNDARLFFYIMLNRIYFDEINVLWESRIFIYSLYPFTLIYRHGLFGTDKRKLDMKDIKSKLFDSNTLNRSHNLSNDLISRKGVSSSSARKVIKEWPVIYSAEIITSNVLTQFGYMTINDIGPEYTTHGFRSNIPSIEESFNSKTKNIVLLGGSFAYGYGLPSEATIGGYLQKLLIKNNIANEWNIIDLSTCGDALDDSFIKYLQLFHLLKPSITIALGGVNDLIKLYKYKEPDVNTPRFIEDIMPPLDQKPKYKNPSPEEILERIELLFRTFIAVSNEYGTKSFSYLQPWLDFSKYITRFQTVPVHFQRLDPRRKQQESIYEYLLAELPQRSNSLISSVLHNSFVDEIKSGADAEQYFMDKTHTTAEGAEFVANTIFKDLFPT
tara:strand:- start:506 stop:2080 length:1575 start_codon:yes stop_codon:yes gene_type:complete